MLEINCLSLSPPLSLYLTLSLLSVSRALLALIVRVIIQFRLIKNILRQFYFTSAHRIKYENGIAGYDEVEDTLLKLYMYFKVVGI